MEPREFRYRPHVKWFQYGIVVFVGLISVLPNTVIAIRTGLDGDMSILALSMALAMGVMTLVLFWLFRTMASTRVTIDDNGIHYRNYRKDFTVGYDEISRLKFPSIPYLGGWIKIISDEPDIRLTVVLEDLDELVSILKEKLDATDNSASYDRDKLFTFYKTAGFSTRSWDRGYRFFVPVTVVTIAIGAAWVFGADAVFDHMTLGTFLFIAATTVLPFFGWMVGEVFLLISLIRGADEETFSLPDRDPGTERRSLAAGYGLFALLCLLVLVVV